MLSAARAAASAARRWALLATVLSLAACVPTLPRSRPVAFSLESKGISVVVNACAGWSPTRAKIAEQASDGNFAEPSWTASNYLGLSRTRIPLNGSFWKEVNGRYDVQNNLMVQVFDKNGFYEIGFWYGRRLPERQVADNTLVMFDDDGNPSYITEADFAKMSGCPTKSSTSISQ